MHSKTKTWGKYMNLITGKEREDLEDLVKQLTLHGAGGGSAVLTDVIGRFCAMNAHELASILAKRLLGLHVTVNVGGGGGE